MQIGELARRVGTTTDTVRFYERSGWLPRAARRRNAYRDYGEDEVEHLRLLIELRRLGLALADAATIAGWCHVGHCADATATLPALLREQRAEVASRMASLRDLDSRLARLERHLATSRSLPLLEASQEACCSAAEAVLEADSGCACCAPVN
jgi:MerR family transcriptional regulator, copper efflux regulator